MRPQLSPGGSGARSPAPTTAATLPVGVECGERMGLLPPEAHNGQRRFREVLALLAVRPQFALLVNVHQCVGSFCLDEGLPE